MRTALRRLVGVATATVLAGGLAVAVPSSANAAGCRTAWGSTAEQQRVMSGALVTGVRAGRHACFDRLVIDLQGDVMGYYVQYVKEVRADGSGQLVPTAGGARLEVTVTAPTFDGTGRVSYAPRDAQRVVGVKGFRTFRQVTYAGSFEGQTTFGLGTRARLPFRVFTLESPGDRSRLVVDVAHRW